MSGGVGCWLGSGGGSVVIGGSEGIFVGGGVVCWGVGDVGGGGGGVVCGSGGAGGSGGGVISRVKDGDTEGMGLR